MNTFVQNIGTPVNSVDGYDASLTLTDNGAVTYTSSMNHCVDLFQRIGSARGQNVNAEFDKAYQESQDLAVRMLLWVRDVRGGSGERQTFRSLLKHLETKEIYHNVLAKVIALTPEIGRWDDVLVFSTQKFKTIAYDLVKAGLQAGNGLLAKWLPREVSNTKEDRQIARELMAHLGLTPRQYRKTIVELTKVVETQMCNKEFENINFSAVPSVATRRYTKAFKKNAPTQYAEFIEKVVSGEATINAGAIFPYDLTSVVRNTFDATEVQVAGLQWDALPDYTNGKRILAMVDLSESMSSYVPGTNHSHKHMAISIGLYVAEKNKGAFKNVFMAFAETPLMDFVKGNDLREKYMSIANSRVGYSTNFQAAFDLILDHAKKNKVSQDEMPEIVVVPSDMQFDSATDSSTNFQSIRTKFENAGYLMPRLVFWQMNGSKKDSQVRATQSGVSLISGFSPAILKAVLGDAEIPEEPEISPIDTMKAALLVDRYNWN